MNIDQIARFPLAWPVGTPRTRTRKLSRFKVKPGRALEDLTDEIRRHVMRDTDFVISSNLPLRLDGTPRSGASRPSDPGVAVYLIRKRKSYVLACDTYVDPYDNIRAICKTLEAMRSIERHGASDLLERAFAGFAALPPAREADPPWREVLKVSRSATAQDVKSAYRRLVLQRVPTLESSGNIEADSSGHEELVQINRAYAQAKEELGF